MTKDIQTLLEANNYELHRQTNHYVYRHRIYIHLIQVCPKTASDYRWELNKKSDIKNQLLQNGLDFIDTYSAISKKKTGEIKMFNTPRIVEGATPVTEQKQEEQKKPEEQPQKRVDNEAIQLMIDGRKNGWSLPRIQEALTNLGYRQKNGLVVNQATISKYLVDAGVRANQPSSHNRETSRYQNASFVSQATVQQAPQKQTAKKTSAFLSELTELLTSNLADPLKEKMAIILIKEKTNWFTQEKT